MTDLSNLREKLEAASEGGAWADNLIALATGWHRVEPRFTRNKKGAWISPEDWIGRHSDGSPIYDQMHGTTLHRDPPRFSTSVDAALALAERCKPDWVGVITLEIAGSGMAYLNHRDPCGEGVQAFGKKPALAICIALLKALGGFVTRHLGEGGPTMTITEAAIERLKDIALGCGLPGGKLHFSKTGAEKLGHDLRALLADHEEARVGVCEGCGSSHTIASLNASGHVSCCPERKMLSAQEWRARAEAAERVQAEQAATMAELVEGIQQANSLLSAHIEQFWDYDYEAHAVPPELQSLRGVCHHLLGTLTAKDGTAINPNGEGEG